MPRRLTRRASTLVLLALAAALSGCVTPATTPTAASGATPPPGQGTVVLRGTLQGLKFLNSFQLAVRPVAPGGAGGPGQGGARPVPLWSASSPGYWGGYYNDGPKGTVTTLNLPAGEYEIFSYSALSGAWGGLRAVQAQTPFSRRFRVVEGEVTYIGHVAVVVRGDAGTLPSAGGAMSLPSQVTVKDEAAQDLKDIGERIVGMTAERVRVRLAQ